MGLLHSLSGLFNKRPAMPRDGFIPVDAVLEEYDCRWRPGRGPMWRAGVVRAGGCGAEHLGACDAANAARRTG